MTDVIAFIDALSPRELTGFFDSTYQGDMDSGVPRVTPRVMSSIYTRENPAENGMMSVSKYGGQDSTRPRTSTFIDQAVREDMSILVMGMPFCIPFQSRNPQSVLNGDALGGQQQTVPPEANSLVQVPAPTADMIQEDPNATYDSFLDQTRSYFTRFKEAIRELDPDVAIIGYRLVDSYCHFQHTEQMPTSHTDETLVEAYRARGNSNLGDGVMPPRQHLIDNVQYLLEEIKDLISGDLMWFSDHGQTELTDVFRVNRWLKDNGYLDYKVDYDFIDQLTEYQGGDQHPVQRRVENQITFGQPGVVLNEDKSDVVCDDPFDSCLTILSDPDEFDTEAFRADLMNTGMYRSVDFRWEVYDNDSTYFETVPHVLPDRKEGVFVSGNLHREPIGMGYYRTGVHDRTACFGGTATLDIPGGTVYPKDMYDIISSFMDLDVTTPPIALEQIQSWTPEEQSLLADKMGGEM
jgi:hypothetical protein